MGKLLTSVDELKIDVATIKEKQEEQSRYRAVIGRWLMWLAGIGVALGMGGTGGVLENKIKNVEQDRDLREIERDVSDLKERVGVH